MDQKCVVKIESNKIATSYYTAFRLFSAINNFVFFWFYDLENVSYEVSESMRGIESTTY